jgi:hypothetical protein
LVLLCCWFWSVLYWEKAMSHEFVEQGLAVNLPENPNDKDFEYSQ